MDIGKLAQRWQKMCHLWHRFYHMCAQSDQGLPIYVDSLQDQSSSLIDEVSAFLARKHRACWRKCQWQRRLYIDWLISYMYNIKSFLSMSKKANFISIGWWLDTDSSRCTVAVAFFEQIWKENPQFNFGIRFFCDNKETKIR